MSKEPKQAASTEKQSRTRTSAATGHTRTLTLFAACTFLGIVYLIGRPSWGLSHASTAREPIYTLKVRGSLSLSSDAERSEVTAHWHIGELPLDQFAHGAKFMGKGQSHFELQTRLRLPQPPKKCDLEVHTNAGIVRCQEVAFTAQPGQQENEVDLIAQLPELRLSPRQGPTGVLSLPVTAVSQRRQPRRDPNLPPKLQRYVAPPVVPKVNR